LIAGELQMSISALQVLEEQSTSPENLQNNFDFVDECGNKGIMLISYDALKIATI
jgi:hypothetical protein